MIFVHIIITILSFVAIWLGAGYIIKSIERFSNNLAVSSFAISFCLLGLLTTIPEFAVGLTAVNDGTPEIFVGNLLGGIPVIFLLVIPVLAISGNGVAVSHHLDIGMKLRILGVIAMPSVLLLDGQLNIFKAVLIILAYGALVWDVHRRHGLIKTGEEQVLELRSYSMVNIGKLLVGIAMVFIAGRYIVENTQYFADMFNISPFLISLFLLSVGTNIPELSLAVRSAFSKRKSVAVGDYLGAAAANTCLLGVFTLMHGSDIRITGNFTVTFVFTIIGLVCFFLCARSRSIITRKEGFFLIGLYVLFIIAELYV